MGKKSRERQLADNEARAVTKQLRTFSSEAEPGSCDDPW